MISQVKNNAASFSDSWYGKKIQAYVNAYGLAYDFCRLYSSDKGGLMLVYNSTATIDGVFDRDELNDMIQLISPVTVECSDNAFVPDGYNQYCKTLFKGVSCVSEISDLKVNTCLDDVYHILEESFGLSEYEAWYADTSHRIRHGVSDVFLWNSTTVTKLFDIDNYVFLSHIATGTADRGKGRARQLLYHLCSKYEKQGKSVYLYAKDERVSFYEGIGFIPVSHSVFYEKGV